MRILSLDLPASVSNARRSVSCAWLSKNVLCRDLRQLLTEKAQRGLAECGLFSAQGYRLYGAGTPVMQAVETALTDGWIPDALRWPEERKTLLHAAQAMYK